MRCRHSPPSGWSLLALAPIWACAPDGAENPEDAAISPGGVASPEAASIEGAGADDAAIESDFELDYGALTEMIVARLALEPGERVLLLGQGGSRWDALTPLLLRAIDAAGGVALGAVDVQGNALPGTEPTPFAELLADGPGGWPGALDEVDAAVKMPGALPDPALPADLYRALQDLLREGRGRTVHFHWAGKTSPEMEELAMDPPADRLYQRAVLETDYEALAATLAEFEAAVRGGEVRVTTPLGTDIRFHVGDQPVTRQDGDASAARAGGARNLIDREVELPAGAVRVLPLLETVEGRIRFPPAPWGGERVERVTMTFEGGRVAMVAAPGAARAAVDAEMAAAGEAGMVFREFALGLNPLLAVPDGEDWIPYYGYGAGVVRLSLGDNTELGGTIGGGYVRWNFFADATVAVDGETWVRDGRLVER